MDGKAAKRSSLRVSKILFAEMTSFDQKEDGATQSLGRTLNISEGGMLLEVAKDMPFQLKVNLRLGFKNEVIEIEGAVIHMRKTEAGDMEVGIEFVNPTDNQLIAINQAMAAAPGKEPA